MMDVTAPTSLLPAAKASGRCPPILIRDDEIVEGGVFEMAMLRALDLTHSPGKCLKSTSEFVLRECREMKDGDVSMFGSDISHWHLMLRFAVHTVLVSSRMYELLSSLFFPHAFCFIGTSY